MNKPNLLFLLLMVFSFIMVHSFDSATVWEQFPENSFIRAACTQEDACIECDILAHLIQCRPYTQEEGVQAVSGLDNQATALKWNEMVHCEKRIELDRSIYRVERSCDRFKNIEKALEREASDSSGCLYCSREDIKEECSKLSFLIRTLLEPIVSQKRDDCTHAVNALHSDAIATNAQDPLKSFMTIYETFLSIYEQDYTTLETLFYKNYDDRVNELKNFLNNQE